MNKFEELRKKYPKFKYNNYKINENENTIEIIFDFEIEGLINFNPSWIFKKNNNFIITISNNLTFERLVFSLGMAEAISYWKASCSPLIEVKCGHIDDSQIKWWKKLFFNGLGEFFYRNEIKTDIESFVNIKSTGKFNSSTEYLNENSEGCLIPIGGGKDSIVTLETLKNAGEKIICYAINDRNSIYNTVLTAGFSPENTLVTSKRKLDRNIIKLNNEGFFNGHTPFSSIVAFSSEITAYLNNLKYIVLSNESSANESTVADMDVNHQYSKSFEFESDFNEYEKKYLDTGIYYFSFLRPLAEFQIAGIFSKYPKYHDIFRSCNLGSKVSPDIWCGDCAKCMFITIILSPFLSHKEIIEIFGKDMTDDMSYKPFFDELIGLTENKPFECVGSIDEVNLSVNIAIENMEKNGEKLPALFQYYKTTALYNPGKNSERLKKHLSSYDEKNLLPPRFSEILKKEMESKLKNV